MLRKIINFAAAAGAMMALYKFILVSVKLAGWEAGVIGFAAAISGGLAAFLWMIPDEELAEWIDFGEEGPENAQ